jgi:hypothetical protein
MIAASKKWNFGTSHRQRQHVTPLARSEEEPKSCALYRGVALRAALSARRMFPVAEKNALA